MRRTLRIALLLALVAPTLSACADFDMDKLDIFGLSEKKKLPGERKDVFPGGVPGVSQGIPPEYMKGYQPPPDTPITPEGAAAISGEPDQKTAAVQPIEEPKPRPKRKPKPRPPVQQTAQPQNQPPPAAPPPQQQTAPWPSSPPPGAAPR